MKINSMLKISEDLRSEIVKIISTSNLPTNQGLGIIQALSSLETIKDVGKVEKEENSSKNGKLSE